MRIIQIFNIRRVINKFGIYIISICFTKLFRNIQQLLVSYITQQMFQNSYQNGTYFELFDPKLSQDKVKNLYKLQNITGNNKVFDKQLKTYVFEFNNASSKIVFPKEDRKQLYLIQQFLNLQISFFQGMAWSIQLSVSDLNKTKRRIILSPTNKMEIKPFFIKFPCSHVQQAINLYSFMNAFKGQTYRSLDVITISGFFKLRRIFTTQQPPIFNSSLDQQIKAINLLPKALFLPSQVQCSNSLVSFQETTIITQQVFEVTESSSKNNKSNTISRHNASTPKTEIMKQQKGYKNEKKFLADTNGPEKNRKKIQNQTEGETDKSRYTQKIVGSSQKKQKRTVGKSEVANKRTSIDKKKPVKEEQKLKVKSKLNPWRSNKKNQTQTDGGGSQLSDTKLIYNNERKTQSAETTLFKTKNNLANRFNESNNKFDHRSDQCSDSEYIELSQKFSTLTEGRFFKNQLGSQQIESNKKQPDQIEENIEIESNQMCQSTNRKQQLLIKELKNQPIDESITDSLDNINMNKGKDNMIVKAAMMNSYYGFGQKLMNKYMDEVERPYSPPLGERQITEQASQRNQQQHDKEVEVIYDPVLNCYYDHKTHTYYELKN